jgi:hypothetical protein
MQAAMPFIDHLVPAHNLESLERALFELVASRAPERGRRDGLPSVAATLGGPRWDPANSGRAGSRGFLP